MIKRRNIGPSFTDMLFIVCFGFMLLAFIMVPFLNPIAKNGTIDPPIAMMIEAQWSAEKDTDVDLYVKGPDKHTVYYGNKSNGYVTLKKDDLGHSTDKMIIDGVTVSIPRNYEITTLNALPDGWYTVNAHLFAGKEETVTIRVTNIMNYEIVYEGSFQIWHRQEKTFISFLVKDGKVIELDQQVQHKLRRGVAAP